MDEAVIQKAIVLRQEKKMSLADAIIAGTTMIHNIPLVTRNTSDFKHIIGLKFINPFQAS